MKRKREGHHDLLDLIHPRNWNSIRIQQILKEWESIPFHVIPDVCRGAIYNNDIAVLDILLQYHIDATYVLPDGGYGLLTPASQYGGRRVVKFLFRKGVRPLDELSRDQLLLYASQCNHFDILNLLEKHSYLPPSGSIHAGKCLRSASCVGAWKSLRFMLQRGYDPNAPSSNMNRPLLIAAENNHTRAVFELLRWGADPNLSYNGHSTALIRMIYNRSSIESVIPIVRRFIAYGADPTIEGYRGCTAFSVCRRIGCPKLLAALMDEYPYDPPDDSIR